MVIPGSSKDTCKSFNLYKDICQVCKFLQQKISGVQRTNEMNNQRFQFKLAGQNFVTRKSCKFIRKYERNVETSKVLTKRTE